MEETKNRHKLLTDLSTELSEGFLEETFEIAGRHWTLRTLNDAEEVWSDKFVSGGTLVSTISSRKAIKLAVSIRAVNDTPIEQLFFFPNTDSGKTEKEFVTANPARERFWYAEKMYEFLEEQPFHFVTELYTKYVELSTRQLKVMKEVLEKNSSTRTRTPVSEDMLSQENASS